MAASASFFSGVGGLDLGLERAGWRTVSFSEIDPYACAVLGSRYPDVPNLGSIVDWRDWPDGEWQRADLWAGGPPCQGFSVAGKRGGLHDERSRLALEWFDAVERRRPGAILLENVPGILSSDAGRDFAAITDRLADLGYGWAYRTLNARFFGVPQRRRRVFLLAFHARSGLGADDAAEVLAVGHRCERHPASGRKAGTEPADRFTDGVGGAGALPQAVNAKWAKGYSGPAGDEHHNLVIAGPVGGGAYGSGRRTEDDPNLVIAGPAWQSHGSNVGPMGTLRGIGGGAAGAGVPFIPFVKRHRAASADDAESWSEGDEAPTLNGFDVGDSRATVAIVAPTLNSNRGGGWRYDPDQAEGLVPDALGVRRLTPLECERLQGWPDGWTIPNEWRGRTFDGSDLLPDGLDSNRYRCIGNGVAAPVATWVGGRLLDYLGGVA